MRIYFDQAAKLLMTDHVAMIEIAPNGVITNTYPDSDTQIGLDLNQDSGALAVMQYAREQDAPVMYGPFTIDTAGECVCITNPVYFNNGGQFWGYVIIAIMGWFKWERMMKDGIPSDTNSVKS